MASTLEDTHWKNLLRRIKDGKCTPFLGAGVNRGVLPLGSEMAQQWAKEYSYPLKDSYDLARVAQFMAVIHQDPMVPKEEILRRWFRNITPPDFKASDEPMGVLADLPLPVYMTTNYDNFMVQALKNHDKQPQRELCRWNKHPNVKRRKSVWDKNRAFRPSCANPVVFHLHGLDELYESLVLTEDDYLDFLVNISKQQKLLPPRIQEALTGSSLLFIGYRLVDLSFRVLFRGLINSMEPSLRRVSVAVQLPPEYSEPDRQKAQNYLTDYFKNMNIQVYWGTAREFASELRERWERFKKEDLKNDT